MTNFVYSMTNFVYTYNTYDRLAHTQHTRACMQAYNMGISADNAAGFDNRCKFYY